MLHLRAPIRSCLHVPRHYRFLSHHTGGRPVKVKRPWIKPFVTTCAVYGAAFYVWTSLVALHIEDDTISGTSSETHEFPSANKSELQKEDSQVPIFIPLSWPLQKPGQLYTGSDPERKKFVQISKDPQLINSLKDELVSMVQKGLTDGSKFEKLTGSPLTPHQIWLLPVFPLRAPPSYELLGLQISRGNVALVSKPIEPETGDRLLRVLLPIVAAAAVGNDLKSLVINQFRKFQAFTSAERKQGSKTTVFKSGEVISQVDTAPLDGAEKQPSSHNDKIGLGSLTESAASGERSTASHPSRVLSSLQRLPLSDIAHGSGIHEKSTLRKRFLEKIAPRRTPRRGVFYVQGPIAFKGPDGQCRFQVRGEYDPTRRKWTSIDVGLTDTHSYRRKPVGR